MPSCPAPFKTPAVIPLFCQASEKALLSEVAAQTPVEAILDTDEP